MKKYPLDQIMNRLSLLLLLGTVVFLTAFWQRIPDEVPMHFNAAGEIDRWSSRTELLILPVISWLVYGLLTVVEQIFRTWTAGGTGMKKKEQVHFLRRHLLSTLKRLVVVIFTWIPVWCALALPLPVWFLPVTLVAVFGDMVYWIVRLIRAQSL